MRIAVVMPTLNEVENIPARARELAAQTGDWQWIVADGGSLDGTVEAARAAGARVVSSPPGRGCQLDAGARSSESEIVLFLHADTALPPDAFEAIRRVLREPAIAGGNFTLRFDEHGAFARFLEWLYGARQKWLRSYFGDSAIFVRRTIYERIGGFGDAPIMEDYAFVIKLHRAGRVRRLPLAVVTSSRRYHGRPLRTLWNWFAIMTLYRLGVPPRKLAGLYRPHRSRIGRP